MLRKLPLNECHASERKLRIIGRINEFDCSYFINIVLLLCGESQQFQ